MRTATLSAVLAFAASSTSAQVCIDQVYVPTSGNGLEVTSNQSVEQTFLGASELLAASDVDPAELRRRVTSPKGTTERAIAELESADLTALFDRATASALARAEELANP